MVVIMFGNEIVVVYIKKIGTSQMKRGKICMKPVFYLIVAYYNDVGVLCNFRTRAQITCKAIL